MSDLFSCAVKPCFSFLHPKLIRESRCASCCNGDECRAAVLTGTPLPPPPPPTEVPPPSAYAYPRSSIPAYQTQQPKPYVALAPPEIKRREELRPDQLSGEINLVLKYFSSKDAKRIKIRKDMSVKDLMTEEKVCEHLGLVS